MFWLDLGGRSAQWTLCVPIQELLVLGSCREKQARKREETGVRHSANTKALCLMNSCGAVQTAHAARACPPLTVEMSRIQSSG